MAWHVAPSTRRGRGTRCQRGEQREENKRTPQEHADLEDAHGLRAPFLHAERACNGRNVSWRARVTGRLGSSRAESKRVGKGAAHRLRAGVAASRAPRGPRLRPTHAVPPSFDAIERRACARRKNAPRGCAAAPGMVEWVDAGTRSRSSPCRPSFKCSSDVFGLTWPREPSEGQPGGDRRAARLCR